MDFALDEDQQALREGVASFCAGRIGIDVLRRLEGTGFDRGLWTELAELGVFGLRTGDASSDPTREAKDEQGSGLAEAVLVFEALGRAVAPGPILACHLAAGLIPGAATGERVVTCIEVAGNSRGPFVVEHLEAADALLVLREDGVERIDARSLLARAEAVAKPLDPLTPIHRVAALPRGERIGDAACAERLRLEGTTLSAALLLGIAEETVALATRHAGERQQFDRPIGSFQAIKHLLADAFVRQELARATVYAAGVLLDAPAAGASTSSRPSDGRARSGSASRPIPSSAPGEAARRAVAAAKFIAGDAAMKNARACIQVQGGMGFTWESPVHYYLKRTWVLENGFGTTARQAETLAAGIAAGITAGAAATA